MRSSEIMDLKEEISQKQNEHLKVQQECENLKTQLISSHNDAREFRDKLLVHEHRELHSHKKGKYFEGQILIYLQDLFEGTSVQVHDVSQHSHRSDVRLEQPLPHSHMRGGKMSINILIEDKHVSKIQPDDHFGKFGKDMQTTRADAGISSSIGDIAIAGTRSAFHRPNRS